MRCNIHDSSNLGKSFAVLVYQFELAYNISIMRVLEVDNEICDTGFEGFM